MTTLRERLAITLDPILKAVYGDRIRPVRMLDVVPIKASRSERAAGAARWCVMLYATDGSLLSDDVLCWTRMRDSDGHPLTLAPLNTGGYAVIVGK